MREELKEWRWWVEDVYFLYPPGPECDKYHYFTKTEDCEPNLTIEEEIALMSKQVDESEGFDIDFSMLRCLFNYHLVDPDDYDFLEEPETNGDLMKRLSLESLNRYNQEWKTSFEFVEVVKANFHFAAGYIFLITFEALDPSDNEKKAFQARVHYSSHNPPVYVFCRLRRDPNVETTDESSEEDVKKGSV